MRIARSRSNFNVEPLERRCLLSGVTVITHGWQSSSNAPNWLNTMAAAIVQDAGPDTAIYKLRIAVDAGVARVVSFEQTAGLSPTSTESSNGESVLLVDWADASGVLTNTFSTSSIASMVVPYLTTPLENNGSHPLVDGPIHLIGHSRGGSLMAALAEYLGQSGIWVDQLTTIDPHPVALTNDYPMSVPSNVTFADNYFETTDLTLLLTDGYASAPVSGSHNTSLDAIGASHKSTHTWYDGTIDTTAISDGDASINPSWYNLAGLGPRDSVGYAYSRIEGGTRPEDGIGQPFGGSEPRVAVSATTEPQWPNIADLSITSAGSQFQVGDTIGTHFLFEDADSVATIKFYLDTDLNPYNGGASTSLRQYAVDPVTTPYVWNDVQVTLSGAPTGQYYLLATISDGNNIRFSYDAAPITLTADTSTPTPPAPSPGPDLTGTFISVPASIPPGGRRNTVRYQIANAGDLPAKGTVNINLYASTDGAWDGFDSLLTSHAQKLNLKPGKSKKITFRFDSPADAADGDYHILAVIDPGGQFSESDTSNNTAVSSGPTTITAPVVDLTPAFYLPPPTIIPGRKTSITVTLTNTGNVLAKGDVNLTLWLSPDNTTGEGAISLGTFSKRVALKPGRTLKLKLKLQIPISITGSYFEGMLSYDGTPADSNLADNNFFSESAVTIL